MIPDTQRLRSAYQKAPDLVQQFITSPELEGTFTEIREGHKLHLDEAGALSSALNAVFLEVVPYEQFPKLLKEALEQNSDQYDSVLKAVNEKIFTEFRKKLALPESTSPATTPEPEKTLEVVAEKATPQSSLVKIEQQITSQPVQAVPTAPNKLETSVRQAPQEVEIKAEPQKSATYSSGADPYREPIE